MAKERSGWMGRKGHSSRRESCVKMKSTGKGMKLHGKKPEQNNNQKVFGEDLGNTIKPNNFAMPTLRRCCSNETLGVCFDLDLPPSNESWGRTCMSCKALPVVLGQQS